MKSSCYSTDNAHQEVEVGPQGCGQGAQGQEERNAGEGAEEGSEAEE